MRSREFFDRGHVGDVILRILRQLRYYILKFHESEEFFLEQKDSGQVFRRSF